MNQLRILQVVPKMEAGGVEEETLLMAEAIQRHGWQAFVACTGGTLVSRLQKVGAHVLILPVASKNPLRIWHNGDRLAQCVKTHGIQLLHVHSRAPAWSVARCAKRLQLPWMTTHHAAYSDTNPFKHFYNSIMARATAVVAISAFMHQHIRHTYGRHSWFRESRLHLIPRGIDTDFFNPHQVPPSTLHLLREQLQIRAEDPVILLPGRFRKLKGHEILLEAFARSCADGQRGTLVYVGETPQEAPYREGLKAHAHALGLASRVRFVPYTQDLRPFYGLADLVVVPSLVPEGFGRVIAEAASCRKVVIASRHGAAPELLPSEEIGFLTRAGDISALHKTLARAQALSPKQREMMGKAARAHIKEAFSQEKFYANTLELYRRCVAQTHPPLEKR